MSTCSFQLTTATYRTFLRFLKHQFRFLSFHEGFLLSFTIAIKDELPIYCKRHSVYKVFWNGEKTRLVWYTCRSLYRDPPRIVSVLFFPKTRHCVYFYFPALCAKLVFDDFSHVKNVVPLTSWRFQQRSHYYSAESSRRILSNGYNYRTKTLEFER